VDISEKAVEKCRCLQTGQAVSPDRLQFVTADYFTYAPSKPYEFIFDYLFFAALPPEFRGVPGGVTAALIASMKPTLAD
jgi:hypothetical protein